MTVIQIIKKKSVKLLTNSEDRVWLDGQHRTFVNPRHKGDFVQTRRLSSITPLGVDGKDCEQARH